MIRVEIVSFGHKFPEGIPNHTLTQQVFDCRHLWNPHWEEGLRDLTGQDARVGAALTTHGAGPFVAMTSVLVQKGIEQEVKRKGETYFVAYGCTGGHHRSVWCAETASYILSRDLPDGLAEIRVTHRELEKGR